MSEQTERDGITIEPTETSDGGFQWIDHLRSSKRNATEGEDDTSSPDHPVPTSLVLMMTIVVITALGWGVMVTV